MRAIVICGLLSGCIIHDSADGDVFGHTFAITVGHASVDATEPDGTQWDSDLSAPDPYVVLFFNGSQVLQTQDVSNSFVGDWNDSVTRVIDRGTDVQADLWDSDPLSMGDLVIRCGSTDSVSAIELREGHMTCTSSGSLLQIFFDKLD